MHALSRTCHMSHKACVACTPCMAWLGFTVTLLVASAWPSLLASYTAIGWELLFIPCIRHACICVTRSQTRDRASMIAYLNCKPSNSNRTGSRRRRLFLSHVSLPSKSNRTEHLVQYCSLTIDAMQPVCHTSTPRYILIPYSM